MDAAEHLGATVVDRRRRRVRRDGLARRLHVLLRPAPLTRAPTASRPGRAACAPWSTRSASTSRPAAYDAECAFWHGLTGWELRVSADHAEFRRLIRPPEQPLQLLLQRLDEPDGQVRAHLDLATNDRTAETDRHVALGAEVRDVRGGWTVLADPTGAAYCITDRTPETRVLDEPPAR